jgi:hypothetical protein
MDTPRKDSNPKAAFGDAKLPLHLVPPIGIAHAALAFLEGALKYGRNNWRYDGVRASTYVAAARRHLDKWFEGENCDPVTRVHHIGNAIACMMILLDAEAGGVLQDDRNYPGGYADAEKTLGPVVNHLRGLFSGMAPKHYTLQDVKPDADPKTAQG